MVLGPVPTNESKLVPDIHASKKKKNCLTSNFCYDNFAFSRISV